MSNVSSVFPDNYFLWDCWYLYEPKTNLFHVFRLSAPIKYKELSVHDKYSKVAYGTTYDFITFDYKAQNVIRLSDEESASVWTSCVIRHKEDKYIMFYTERQSLKNYWASQSIKMAVSKNLSHWELMKDGIIAPNTIDPDEKYFVRQPQPGDRTVNAWRDPYIFKDGQSYYMLVSAKLKEGEKYHNACVALLQANNEELTEWTLKNPCLVTGYEELEVAQVYRDMSSGDILLVASTWDDNDYEESMKKGYDPYVNAPKTTYRSKGYLLGFRAKSLDDLIQGKFINSQEGEIIIRPEEKIYACTVVPELKGSLIGFDISSDTGDLKIINARLPQLQHIDDNLKYYG